MAENISIQRSSCSILGLTATVASSANEVWFFRFRVFFGACTLQNEVTPNLFCLVGNSVSLPFCVASLKKSVRGNFWVRTSLSVLPRTRHSKHLSLDLLIRSWVHHSWDQKTSFKCKHIFSPRKFKFDLFCSSLILIGCIFLVFSVARKQRQTDSAGKYNFKCYPATHRRNAQGKWDRRHAEYWVHWQTVKWHEYKFWWGVWWIWWST